MKIYTKGGDGGETSLIGGQRVSKSDLRIRAYGAVNELNAVVGKVRSYEGKNRLNPALAVIQRTLFTIGSRLACPDPESPLLSGLEALSTVEIETWIDEIEAELPDVKHFILPGGVPMAACLHFGCTICRRVEREVVALSQVESVPSEVLVYLNRLSDFLFVAARLTNHRAGVSEELWNE